MDDQTAKRLPPSAKLVLKVLEHEGALTQKDIIERTRLSQRTAREALERLQENDVVEKEMYIPDARQDLYSLTTSEE
ncbi:MarR family transcriptional regulator [Halarchaeum nitratireducens]|uniref:MarR family transcriptional regulator n=1 Tax=Halarchaeum nitratireducens TaxID=489913 RepID=A0A830G8K6_9EURY|nr:MULTISPECIES: helix-turn-helix domain-containing protein [Halarchaeum]MBP2250091.1 DNA-binding MarR family transcriptional regulator [Halarchaeum solikamskense]GGN08562.1 MarR family transcriptional regulator [Halarchaeum nitratireducens]